MKKSIVFLIGTMVIGSLLFAEEIRPMSNEEKIFLQLDRLSSIVNALKQDKDLKKIIEEADLIWQEKMATMERQKQVIKLQSDKIIEQNKTIEELRGRLGELGDAKVKE